MEPRLKSHFRITLMKKINIIIADDHPVVLAGLKAVLETQKDFNILSTARNGFEVINQTKELNPDIILLDIEMPEMNGVETLISLKNQNLFVKVIIFTAFDSDDKIMQALKAGAKGYLLKGSPREELFNAIRVVFNGGTLLQPLITSKLIEQINEPKHVSDNKLTARELEVLQQLAKGKLNKEIAQKLNINERTVKFHVSSIFKKLNVQNRTEAVTKAVQIKLIQI